MSRLMNAMLASGGYGSVRGAISDGRPYRDNWVAGVHGDPGIFGWWESNSMAAYQRHMDETPTIYSMAVIYELPGVQSCAESKIA